MQTVSWNPPQHWPALCMAARLAPPACGQRAYRSTAGNVRFFPAQMLCTGRPVRWFQINGDEEIAIKRDTRLSDAECARLWATRPQ